MEEAGIRLKELRFVAAVNSIKLEENYHYVTLFMQGEVDKDFLTSVPVNMEPEKNEGKRAWCFVKGKLPVILSWFDRIKSVIYVALLTLYSVKKEASHKLIKSSCLKISPLHIKTWV